MLLLFLSLLLAQPADQPPPSTPPAQPAAPQPSQVKPPPPAPTVANADDLLRALEHADHDLKTLRADILLRKVSGLVGDDQTRWGELFFEDRTPEPTEAVPTPPRDRRFAVRFTRFQTGRRLDDEPQNFVFSGSTLTETRPTRKELTRYILTAPNEKPLDPLKIGEGPIPLPLGQKRDDIAARFEAALLPADQDIPDGSQHSAFEQHIHGAQQLKLTPRPGLKGVGDLTDIRLWYRFADGRWLPVAARTLNNAGDETTVRLSNVRVNGPIDSHVWTSEDPGPDWTVVERNLADRQGR